MTQPLGIVDTEPEAESETNSKQSQQLTIASPAKIEPRASTLRKRRLIQRSGRRDDVGDEIVDIKLNLL